FARMLESVVLICGHCQGLLLHLQITFDPSQWWTLISVALRGLPCAVKPQNTRFQGAIPAVAARAGVDSRVSGAASAAA
ncbi:hypothetical protein, partial [Acidovorax sp.]|uniref:hypothetical protein n=1 Tax=Acidovorax sp. TaxID=1872122 RepID=UPI0025BFF3F6